MCLGAVFQDALSLLLAFLSNITYRSLLAKITGSIDGFAPTLIIHTRIFSRVWIYTLSPLVTEALSSILNCAYRYDDPIAHRSAT